MVGLARLDDLQELRRVGRRRRRRGRPDRGRLLARRGVDPDARRAGLARRRPHRRGSPTPSRASRPTTAAPSSSAYDFLAAPVDEVRAELLAARPRARRRVRAGVLRADPAGAGRSQLGARPARRRHVRADAGRAATASTPASRSAATSCSTTTARSRAAAAPSTSSAASTASASRSSRIDFTGARWRKENERGDGAVRAAGGRGAARRRAPAGDARPDGARARAERRAGELRAQLAAAEARVGLRPWLRRRLGRPR